MSSHCLLASGFWWKLAIKLRSLCKWLVAFLIFSLSLALNNFIMRWVYPAWTFLNFLNIFINGSHEIWWDFGYCYFTYLHCPSLIYLLLILYFIPCLLFFWGLFFVHMLVPCLFFWGLFFVHMLVCLLYYTGPWGSASFFSCPYFLTHCSSDWISINLSSNLLFLPFSCSNLLFSLAVALCLPKLYIKGVPHSTCESILIWK